MGAATSLQSRGRLKSRVFLESDDKSRQYFQMQCSNKLSLNRDIHFSQTHRLGEEDLRKVGTFNWEADLETMSSLHD